MQNDEAVVSISKARQERSQIMDSPIVSWSFVNDKMGQCKEAAAASRFLMHVGAKESEIDVLRYVPLIIHFYRLLAETCNLRVSKEDYRKLTMKEVVEKVSKEGVFSTLWEDFKECWRSVQEQGCNAQLEAEGKVAEINDETLFCEVIDSIIKTLRDGMGKLQDGIVAKLEAEFGKNKKRAHHFF